MGAWPALTYELPALAQRVLGETFFAEAVFTVGLLAFALALTARTATELSGRASAVIVTIATLFASTKLYGYSKVLVFAVAAALFLRYVRQPTRARAAQLGAWSAVAFLFRHDFLIYLAPPVAILMLLGTPRWREAFDRLLVYAGHGRAAARRYPSTRFSTTSASARISKRRARSSPRRPTGRRSAGRTSGLRPAASGRFCSRKATRWRGCTT